MKLIFIYGPPAVGKTTVGSKLAERIGYRFFFNHLTVPAAKAIFPDTSNLHEVAGYHPLLKQFRITGITAAAKAGLDMIFTVAYSGRPDDEFVSEIVSTFTSHGGEVHFVQLCAPEHILVERVGNKSRSDLHLGKMTDPEHLKAILKSRDMHASVQYEPILKISTHEYTSEESADRIVDYFHLSDKSR